MKKNVTKYSILLTLALLFAAPGIAAYLFYQHPSWLGASKINKGTLLTSPIKLSSIKNKSKWNIIFWNPNDCAQQCLQQLDVLARVRLALGRKLYQVDQWLIVDENENWLSPQLHTVLKERDFLVTHWSSAEKEQLLGLHSNPRIFIANPDNYLILSYPEGVNPDDIYKDLKLLLNTTETKSG